MGLADRFANSVLVQEVKVKPVPVSVPVSQPQETKLQTLKQQLFEKIVSVPCWFEYDEATQYKLIIKFLQSKDVKTPEIFAKVLQHSMLGFGIFDDYLLKKDISAIFYEEGEPLFYTEGDRNVVDTAIIPVAKVRLAVQNIINMSQCSDRNGVYNFRIADFWVQLHAVEHSKIKLTIQRVNEEFLQEQIDSANLSLLLSGF